MSRLDVYTHSAVFRRNAGSEPVFGRGRAFRRNTVTSLRKGDACSPLAAGRSRRTEKTTMVRRGVDGSFRSRTPRSPRNSGHALLTASRSVAGSVRRLAATVLYPSGNSSPCRAARFTSNRIAPQLHTCEREVVHLRQDHPSVVARHLRVRAWDAAQSPHPLVTICSRTALCPVRLLPEVVVGGVGDLGHGSCRCRVAVCGGGNVAAGGCDSLDVGGVPEPAGGR